MYSFLSLRELSRFFITNILSSGDTAIDCTLGNGHDSEFMLSLVGSSGFVHAFDVQEAAIASSKKLLGEPENLKLHLCGHENLSKVLPADLKGKIAAAMLNLGYLPGGDKSLVTAEQSTIACLGELLLWLRAGAGISVHIYTGHSGGEGEGEAVLNFAKKLDWAKWQVASYTFLNKQSNKETLLLIKSRA